MKISPVTGAAPQVLNPTEGLSAGADRMARAKAIASGQQPHAPVEKEAQANPQSLNRIRMKTQVSPDRQPQPSPVEVKQPETEVKSDVLDTNEQASAALDASKPLSPQAVALIKQRRALQLKEQELLAKEKDLNTHATDRKSLEDYRGRIKANALSVLLEEGVTYDQLTEQILSQNQSSADYSGLKADIEALKQGLESQNKSHAEREAQAEQQVRNQIQREVKQLVAQGDDFEMIREAGYAGKVVELIDKTWKATGELLEASEAANLIEKELLDDGLKYAKLKKVQRRLQPPQQQTQQVAQDRPGTKVMRTLTTRDGGTSLSMSKRDRAIAAMEGRLK